MILVKRPPEFLEAPTRSPETEGGNGRCFVRSPRIRARKWTF